MYNEFVVKDVKKEQSCVRKLKSNENRDCYHIAHPYKDKVVVLNWSPSSF